MIITYFATPAEFRKWLEKYHKKKTELFVGFYKGGNNSCIPWSQSVDQALCFGWTDGVQKSIDQRSYCVRFAPRERASIWSAVDIKKVEELNKSGLMTSAGQEAFNLRIENKSRILTE